MDRRRRRRQTATLPVGRHRRGLPSRRVGPRRAARAATGATGPDTVGAHPDGATPLGIHDLAGNVAEWVETARGACDAGAERRCLGVVRGGSYDTDLATELRTWVRREVPASSTRGDDRIPLRVRRVARRRLVTP